MNVLPYLPPPPPPQKLTDNYKSEENSSNVEVLMVTLMGQLEEFI